MSGRAVLGLVLSVQIAGAHEVVVRDSDLTRTGSGPLILSGVSGSPRDPALGVVDPSVTDPVAGLLRRLVARGESQGFGGILYENRDRGHSTLSRALFPNLTFLTYDEELRARGLDYGLARPVLIPALVLGNSSTAITGGARPRSLVRQAMTMPGGAARAYRDYVSNSLYVYPEHRDHDLTDLYSANWPYTIVSQGSSGSDIPFLKAVAMTLAAFSSETRAAMETAGLVAPTVQMILRRNLSSVRTRADYLSPLAHPTVFPAARLQTGRMVQQAAAMLPGDIPPQVRLRVLDETFTLNAGLNDGDEHLFTTPSALARIWRGTAWENRMTLSAETSRDVAGRDLQFSWVLLRGDPERVRIEPLNDSGSQARLTVAWHDAFVIAPHSPDADVPRRSSRVDIGVFASNGVADSAPAMISISFPTHQLRRYEPGPDGVIRIDSIDYDAIARGQPYDPALHWSAPWVDRFHYEADGTPAGWTRVQNGTETRYSADGSRTDGGRVSYRIMDTGGHKPTLAEIGAARGN